MACGSCGKVARVKRPAPKAIPAVVPPVEVAKVTASNGVHIRKKPRRFEVG